MPGSSPNWTTGYIPPASEWNGLWAGKADFILTTATIQTVSNIASLRAFVGTVAAVLVLGYYTVGDLGAGPFTVMSSDTTSADNGGTIIIDGLNRRWYRQTGGKSVSISAFGAKVDGVSNDSVPIASTIAAAIAQKFEIWCPAGTSPLGTTPLAFPNTTPEGFSFQCHPDFTLSYSGTGSAITIDSCYHADFHFGRIVGTAGGTSTGLHIQPVNVGANGQNTCVVSNFGFVFIGGFATGLLFDCNSGSIAQVTVNGTEINNGFGLAAGALTTAATGIDVFGTSPNIFQGNVVYVNYIQPSQAGFASGVTWIGINDGSLTFGASLDNVNQFTYGAIDGAGYNLSFGLNIFSGNNAFTGPIVDVQTGIQFEAGATSISIITAGINVNGGGTRIHNISGSSEGVFSLIGPQGFAASIQSAGPSGNTGSVNIPNGTLILVGSVNLSASPTTFSFPQDFQTLPFMVGSQSDNISGSSVDVAAISASQYVVHGPTGVTINWMAIGQVEVT